MTENEAIKVFKELLDVPCEMLVKYDSVATEEQKKALVRIRVSEDMAIQALEEIQQYRAIGLTPELIEAMKGHNIALINDLGEYQQIGTIDEFKALKEKNEPKKIAHQGCYDADGVLHIWNGINGMPYDLCPNCEINFCTDGRFGRDKRKIKYCNNCGQKLDWSE